MTTTAIKAFLTKNLRAIVAVILILSAGFIGRIAMAAQDHGGGHAAPPAATEHGATTAPTDHGDEHAKEGHGGAAGHHGPDPINWADIGDKGRPAWIEKERPAFIGLVVNFGLLIALYYTLGRKPIAAGLKQRRVNIGKDIEDARAMLEEAKERAKKYQAELKNADADAATAKAGIITAGKGEVDRQLLEAEERADRMQRDAERLVEQEKKQIHQDLLVETINLAVNQAHKLLERSATPEDHARLANELLAELGRKPAAPRMVGGASTAPPRSTGGAT